MSGGSKSASATTDTTSKDEKFNGYIAPGMTIQPFFPGQEGLLAQQIAQGFGSSQADVGAMLASLYSPMMIGLQSDGSIGPGGSGSSSVRSRRPLSRRSCL